MTEVQRECRSASPMTGDLTIERTRPGGAMIASAGTHSEILVVLIGLGNRVDLIAGKHSIERPAVDVEQSGSRRHVSLCLSEHIQNVAPFDIFETWSVAEQKLPVLGQRG